MGTPCGTQVASPAASTGGLLLTLLVLAAPVRLEGQTVQGRVTDAQSGRPVASALVRLLDPGGEARVVAAADSAGRYRIRAPGPGSFRVRAEQLGYETLETEPFELMDSLQTIDVALVLTPAPIPIRGVEVSTDVANRRIRQALGVSPGQLRIRPVRETAIRDHAQRGHGLSEMLSWQQIPSFEVLRSREGPCYQVRGRGCLPVYLDGARLSRASIPTLPLEMLSTVVVVLSGEAIAYPSGAIHLFSVGYMR